MLDIIIQTSLAIVAKTERLIENVRLQSGSLDDVQHELDRLADAVFLLEDAANLLRRTFETRPDIARGMVHATLQ